MQFLTPGATTPGLRFANSDLGATVAMALTGADNPVAGDQIGRVNQVAVTNVQALQFTSPLTWAGQSLQMVMTNAGAQWTGGDPGNTITIVVTYLLWSPSLQRFV